MKEFAKMQDKPLQEVYEFDKDHELYKTLKQEANDVKRLFQHTRSPHPSTHEPHKNDHNIRG